MKYLYYPGCSLKSSGKPYEESLLAVFKRLNVAVEEVNDWNCCGATAYMAINEKQAVGITARNLALADMQANQTETTLMAPCNACYMGLLKTQNYLENEPSLKNDVFATLKSVGLTYDGYVKVRHPLDVITNDLGLQKVSDAVTKPLKGVKVVSYYGCQVVRPLSTFDDMRDPQTMDNIVKALGATAVDWPLKVRCCGGSMTNTVPDVGLRLNYLILKEAKLHGADMIITACPLCQFNLECLQEKIKAKFNDDVSIPVLFFPQLMGMAMGIDGRELGIHRMFVQPQLSY